MGDCDKMRGAGYIFDCCSSCHDDWEELDREMCHFTLNGEDLHVCCNATDAPIVDTTGVSTEGASWAMEASK